MALRVFPVPPREDRGGVSLRFVHDSRHRHARGPDACQEDGSSYASGGKERRKQRAPDPAAHRKQRRPWSWKAGEQADRGVHRYLLVLVLAVGDKAVGVSAGRNTGWNASQRKSYGGSPILLASRETPFQ